MSSGPGDTMSDDNTDTVAVPREPFIEHVVALARECTTHDNYNVDVNPPERGVDAEVEWYWEDVEWEVATSAEQNYMVLHGRMEGEYSVQTARKTRHHPAEYERRTMPLCVNLVAEFDDANTPLDFAEFSIDVMVA